MSKSPAWPSGVADDHTPFEFSTAYAAGEPVTVRVLVEPTAAEPSARANLDAALDVLDGLARRYKLPLTRFDAIRDLFLPAEPEGEFSLWFSLVFRRDAPPGVKVYFNPEVRGQDEAPLLVEEGLARMGFGAGHSTVVEHARRREPGMDRYSFFAIDLTDSSRARVKIYVSHRDATADDVEVAAKAAYGVRPESLQDFVMLTGGTGPFTGRPLVSSYTFMTGDGERPRGYSLYVPVRSYVNDDVEARERVLAVLDKYHVDPQPFEDSLARVARRPLADGVGLIAHVSLRMGAPRPGVTVYLSSEAYHTAAPRAATLVS